jgi:hypothetical protein
VASRRLARTTCDSTELRAKKDSPTLTSEATGEKRFRPSRVMRSAFAGISATFRSYSDVPNRSVIVLFVPLGLLTRKRVKP